MRAVFRTVWAICLLRTGPQDLPCSAALLRFFGGLYLITGFLSSMVSMNPSVAMALSLLDVLFLFVFTCLLLLLSGYLPRFRQTLLAQLGVGAVMMFFSVPLLLWQSMGEGKGLSALLITFLMFWNLAVMGHIFRHAINVSVLTGAVLSISYLALSLMMFGWIASNVQ